ncbi:MAG: sulfatase [Nitrospinae bacterium]|nr:sulfatase [Nitrospinota bacterium]
MNIPFKPGKSPSLKRAILAGGLIFAAWFLLEIGAYSGFEVMGETDKTLQDFVESNYFWFNIGYQIYILAVFVAIGGISGLLGGLYARKFGGGWIATLGAPILIFVSAQFKTLLHQPQFYDGPFLDGKPWLREIVFSPTAYIEPAWADWALYTLIAGLALAPAVSITQWVTFSKKRAAATVSAVAVFLLWEIAGAIPAQTPHSQKRNVVLIVLDSLRADHLTSNGYKRDTTPEIDDLAREGALFTKNIVDLPRTFPSWVSMMTGVYPMSHGVRHMFPTAEQRRLVHPPLPKILAQDGWQTAVVSDFAGDIFPRIDFGFQTVDTPDLTFDEVVKMRNLEIHPAALAFFNNPLGHTLFPSIRELSYNCDPAALTDKAIKTLRSFRGEKPFFLAIFYSATHMPYAAPGPYYRQYADPAYRGNYRFQKKNLLMKNDNDTPADVQQVIDLFDGGLRATDEQIGRLRETLAAMGYGEDTAIIVTGDHGENFFEYRAEIGHGNHLRGPHAITVPVVIHAPWLKNKGVKVDYQTRMIDLAPTMAELAGYDKFHAEGKSVLPFISGAETGHRLTYTESGLWYVDEGPFFFQNSRIHYPGITQLCEVDPDWRNEVALKKRYQPLVVMAKHRAVSDGAHKLIVMPTENGVVTELYDLGNDPEEQHDISKENPEALRKMMGKLNEVARPENSTKEYQGYLFDRRDYSW